MEKITKLLERHKITKGFEGDRGLNTGGMGAYSPSRLETEILNRKIIKKIIEPTLHGLKDLGCEYKGFYTLV